MLLLQGDAAAAPLVLHTLTAACQNDHNCKWLAKHGAAVTVANLLFSTSSDTVFEALCLLYTMTTEEEARKAVGQACAKVTAPSTASAVQQIFVILAASNAGVLCCGPSIIALVTATGLVSPRHASTHERSQHKLSAQRLCTSTHTCQLAISASASICPTRQRRCLNSRKGLSTASSCHCSCH